MTHALAWIWALTAAAVAGALGSTAPGAIAARRDAERARAQLHATARDAQEILRLRSQLPGSPAQDRARGGLAPRVAAALERAGLPVAALESLSPEAQSAAGDAATVLRRRATLTLAGLTLPQLGRFVEAWRAAEPAWIPTSIDLTPAAGPPPEAGGDLPLRAVVSLESVAIRGQGDAR